MKTYMLLASMLFFFVFNASVTAQQTGKVEYKHLGVSFTIPAGWMGQEGDGAYMMGSNSIPGIVMIIPHEATSIQQLQQEAQEGFQDQNGTAMKPSSDFVSLGSNTTACEFSGTAEFKPARAFVAGMINPHGSGLTIMAMTLKDMYNDKHEKVVKDIVNSVQFYEPVVPPVVKQWEKDFKGVRLTYMDSYTSIDYSNSDVATGGGYSHEEVIHLCPEGYFNYGKSFNLSVTTEGVSAYKDSPDQGAGKWKVIANSAGEPVLQLNFYDGKVYEYVLSKKDDKTYLNGKRYFYTWKGEYAPKCD